MNGEQMTVEKIASIKDPAERRKAIAENLHLFETEKREAEA